MESSKSDRPMTPLVAALWTIALWLGEQTCVSVTEAVRPGAMTDKVNLAACQVLATSLAVFAMVRVHAREASLRLTLGVRPPAPLHVLLAAAVGAGLYPFVSTVDGIVFKRWPLGPDEAAFAEKVLGVPTLHERIALVATAFVILPVTRELFFRGILFGEIRRATSAQASVVATALLFAIYPGDPRQLPTTAVLGLALAVLRERTGTVVTTIVAHLAFWAVEGIPVLSGRDPAVDITYPPRWIAGGASIAVLALLAAGLGRREEE
jgi:membrane protease YdiL (CAAX protease family)